ITNGQVNPSNPDWRQTHTVKPSTSTGRPLFPAKMTLTLPSVRTSAMAAVLAGLRSLRAG
ncbi:unnamed protein product, partial [Protopolystoma xenopodis]